jgi:hypothetical protein
MDADEKLICDFLKSWGSQYVSAREIARRAGGKWRYREDEKWAFPVLMRLMEQAILESDAGGHYRLRPEEKKEKKQQWISPQLKKILEESGKDFGQDLDADEDEEQ